MQKSNPFAILEYEIVPMNQLIYSFAFWNQTSAPVIRFFDASAFFFRNVTDSTTSNAMA